MVPPAHTQRVYLAFSGYALVMPPLFAAGSCPLLVVLRSRPLSSSAAAARNHCRRSAVSAIHRPRHRLLSSSSRVCDSHPCNIRSAVAARASSSPLLSHHCHRPEPCCLHRHLSSAGATNSCPKPSSPPRHLPRSASTRSSWHLLLSPPSYLNLFDCCVTAIFPK